MLRAVLLGAEDQRHRREHLRLPASLVPKDPHLFFYVDVWYFIPFARYFLNSVIVSVHRDRWRNVVFNALAGYALTRSSAASALVLLLFISCMMVPFQATIIPAYLITGRLGLLNTHLGLALPLLSTIICIFVFKASFEAVPRSLIDAARIDGLPEWRIVCGSCCRCQAGDRHQRHPRLHLVVEQLPVAADHHPRRRHADTAPRALRVSSAYHEDTTGALYAFCVMVLAPGHAPLPAGAKGVHPGLTSGATKG